jgi:murein DD-endopeptidase MepM/ murein hydrolase activator NlpD
LACSGWRKINHVGVKVAGCNAGGAGLENSGEDVSMPHRSADHHLSYHPYPADARTRQPAPAVARRGDGYTFAHRGRQIRIGPIAFWVVVGTLVIMAAWSLTTATYFAFREDVLTRLVSREAEMQFSYEDRIAELRAQIDRLSSRQLLDQEQYEQKLEQLIRRQATLEQRATALGALPDPAATGSIKSSARNGAASPQRSPSPKLSPSGDAGQYLAAPAREAHLDLGSAGYSLASVAGGIDATLNRVRVSLDRIEARQRAQLRLLEETYRSRAQRLRGALTELGLGAGKIAAPRGGSEPGLGGPFVAALPLADPGTFDRQVRNVSVARAQVDQLSRTLMNIPVRKPVAGESEIVSGFGVRIDPFLARPAMHTGIDFRAEIGDPILATANGTVTVAGWSGGYGRMVEVDHGNGIATRYGHMSEIEVKVGQPVRIGQTLGRVGTTGRSTGPHLHYETRIDGEPVDPQRFLGAGIKLAEVM